MVKKILVIYATLAIVGFAIGYTPPPDKLPIIPSAEAFIPLIAARHVSGVDVTPPTVTEGAGTNIDTNGTLLTIAFSEAVSEGVSYSDGDWTLACTTTGPLTVAHSTGDGTSSWGLTISGGPVQESGTDTCTLDWAGTANGVEDGSGNDLAAIDPVKSIVNNSTQGAGIARLGYGSFYSDSGDSSQDITVPDGTDFLIVYVSGHNPTTDYFTDAGASFDIESVAATVGCTASDASDSLSAGACFYLLDPTTGSGVTLDWYWKYSSSAWEGVLFVWVAYSGVDSVRSNYGDQEGAPQYETTELTSSSGDLISVAVFGHAVSEGSVTTWSNATEVDEFSAYVNADLTLAEHASSGNVTIGTDTVNDYGEGGIMAVIMIPTE